MKVKILISVWKEGEFVGQATHEDTTYEETYCRDSNFCHDLYLKAVEIMKKSLPRLESEIADFDVRDVSSWNTHAEKICVHFHNDETENFFVEYQEV